MGKEMGRQRKRETDRIARFIIRLLMNDMKDPEHILQRVACETGR